MRQQYLILLVPICFLSYLAFRIFLISLQNYKDAKELKARSVILDGKVVGRPETTYVSVAGRGGYRLTKLTVEFNYEGQTHQTQTTDTREWHTGDFVQVRYDPTGYYEPVLLTYNSMQQYMIYLGFFLGVVFAIGSVVLTVLLISLL